MANRRATFLKELSPFSMALTTFSRKSTEYGFISDLLLQGFIVLYLNANRCKVRLTNRDTRCLKVLLKRSM